MKPLQKEKKITEFEDEHPVFAKAIAKMIANQTMFIGALEIVLKKFGIKKATICDGVVIEFVDKEIFIRPKN